LLRAFEQLRAERLTDALVIVGKRGWLYGEFFTELEDSPVREAVLFPGYVPDIDLPAVYAGAQAFVFPSLYEGFGLPVLEAMATGTPVACGTTSSLPEVSGQAALHFDPRRVESIISVVRRLLADSLQRDELITRGFEQAAKFSWKQTAVETSAVYDRLLASSAI